MSMDHKDVNRKLAWASLLVMISLLMFVMDRLTGCSTEKPQVRQAVGDYQIPTAPPTEPPPPIKDTNAKFLALEEIEDLILRDLSRPELNQADRENYRYLVISDIVNEGGDTKQAGEGLDKTINSLSTERALVAGEMIDPDKSIMRIDLRDYFGSKGRAVWQRFEKDAIIKVVSKTVRGQTLQFLAQAVQPWAHGRVFTETMMTGTTYYDTVGIPATLALFYSQFAGVIPQVEFDAQNEGLTLVGSQNSLISENNRMLWRLDGQEGGVWQTFDVDNKNVGAAQNLFENPFPLEVNPLVLRLAEEKLASRDRPKPPPPKPTPAPPPAPPKPVRQILTNKIFQHAASEVIASLPNGMLAFALFNAAGNRENSAPQTVVTNTRAVGLGLSSELQNARDCSGCHTAGYIRFTDEIGAHIIGSSVFNDVEKELGRELYRSQREVDRLMEKDNDQFASALDRLGLPLDQDPLNVGLLDNVRSGISFKEAAAFFFLEEGDFLARLRGVQTAQAEVGTLIRGGSLSFQQFINSAPQIILDLNLFEDIR
jgi:hypothetical protein